jgi:hypothetical protein
MQINKIITGVVVLVGLLVGSLGAGIFLGQWPLSVSAAQEPKTHPLYLPLVQSQGSLSANPASPTQEDNDTNQAGAVADGGRFCSATASLQFEACGNEVKDDFLIEKAKCLNIPNEKKREKCLTEASAARQETNQLCREQHRARLNLCTALGEDRYNPNFNPARFDADFTNLTNPNPYLPLTIGNRWEYGGDETVIVEVLNETKLIKGVTCIVVNDRVEVDGQLVEDTDDWFAQAKNGNVWYCGEEVKDFEAFPGDNPQIPELVSIDGSFKVGRDGDKPGIIFLRTPTLGDIYRQEWSLGNAEDVAKVLSTNYSFGSNPKLDKFVPRQLVKLLCANECIVTGEFTPIEPDAFELKYYAPGIGQFLSVNPKEGDVVRLVGCNFDARCADLPAP